MRADKKKVTDEVWDDERVRSFLTGTPADSRDSADFALLLTAYQSMRPGDFERFIGFFSAENHDLDATNERGETLVDYIASHRHGTAFIEIMCNAGARAGNE